MPDVVNQSNEEEEESTEWMLERGRALVGVGRSGGWWMLWQSFGVSRSLSRDGPSLQRDFFVLFWVRKGGGRARKGREREAGSRGKGKGGWRRSVAARAGGGGDSHAFNNHARALALSFPRKDRVPSTESTHLAVK